MASCLNSSVYRARAIPVMQTPPMPILHNQPWGTFFRGKVRALEEPYHDYWFHLGKFIHAFAQIEAQLLLLLVRTAGLSGIKAGALFHGIRQEGARDSINNLLQATKQFEKKRRLESSFAQIATIGTVRNNIVHWGARLDGFGLFVVSNSERKPLKRKTYSVTIDEFRSMNSDLSRISFILMAERGYIKASHEMIEKYALLPWLYKPPQPCPPKNRPLQDRQSPKRQRRASPKSRAREQG